MLRTEPSPSSSIRDVAPNSVMMMVISIVVQTRWNPISTSGSRLENAMARLVRSTQRHLKLAMLAFINVNVDC